MLRISKQNDDVVIRDISLSDLVKTGSITIVTFLLIYFIIDEYKKILLPYVITALAILIAGIYQLSRVPITTVKINKKKKLISVQRRSVIRNHFQVYRFSEIAESIYVEKTPDNGKIRYKLLLPLLTGERIELSSPVSFGESQLFEASDVINNVIFNKPMKIPQTFTGFNKF